MKRIIQKPKLTLKQQKKRQSAADSLYGIWACLSKKNQKELMRKSYP